MKWRPSTDVSGLPEVAFGTKATTWWGTLGFVALESMGFALAMAAYLYLEHLNPEWPPAVPPPNPIAGVVFTVLLLVTLWPNTRVKRDAEQFDLPRVRLGMVVMTVVGFVLLVIRGFEFASLNVQWDDNAYGSVLWFVLGLHTLHLVTDLGDTVVLTVLMFTKHAKGRRFSDVADNAFYWYFVVGAWLPLALLLYLVPQR